MRELWRASDAQLETVPPDLQAAVQRLWIVVCCTQMEATSWSALFFLLLFVLLPSLEKMINIITYD